VPAGRRLRARVTAKETAVLCGRAWFADCLLALDAGAELTWHVAEGDATTEGGLVCEIEAEARALLSAERSALNFLQLLSATATTTRALCRRHRRRQPQRARLRRARHAQDAAGPAPGAEVRGARRRWPEPAAGAVARHPDQGEPHRRGRRHHRRAPGAAALASGVPVQVEVESLAELQQALDAGATSVLLDDFDLPRLREAVALNAAHERPALLEVSGSVQLEQLREIAATGVDRVSIGRLTKDVKAVDFSMRVLGPA
jgi:nicotinate-nucleotide pyrophosphorylase (carboxylating)